MATGTDVGSSLEHGFIHERYAIGKIAGRGGAAIVYHAQDVTTGRNVAVKVLRRDLADATLTKRFLREIQVAAQLRHPNIVSVLDSGEIDGVPYYVMPVFTDGTLAQRLQTTGALPFDVVLQIASELAAALDFAHAYDILHRDVKPQNVLFDGKHPLLADFGIARALGRDSISLTDSGVVLGTPLYMSPEQGCGDNVDCRSDVYSLGCLVYEMIAGEPPFSGSTAQAVIAKHMAEQVPSIQVVRPTVPTGVQDVLECALAKVPADRFATAGEFARALAGAMPNYGPVVVSGGSARRFPAYTPSTSRHIRLRRWAWRLAAGTILLSIAGLFVARAVARRQTDGAVGPDPKNIAVLYFDDLSPGGTTSSLADAFTETLIDQLSTVPALHVTSAAGVRRYRNGAPPIDSIAHALNVGTIISGSVQRTGDSVRLTARLVDAANGQQLYSKTMFQPWATIFRLQDSLTTAMAFALRQRLGDVIAMRVPQGSTKSQRAWDEVQLANQTLKDALAGNSEPDDRRTAEVFLRADSAYQRAESLDPNWSTPTFRRARIARLLGRMEANIAPPTNEPLPQSSSEDTSAQMRWDARAIRLADSSLHKGADSAAVMALRAGVLYDRAWRLMGRGASDSLFRAAQAGFESAVNARPNLATAWATLADIYMKDGRFADAADAARRGYSADAFFEVRATISKGFSAALYSQHFDEAKTWCEAGQSRYPGHPLFAECRLTLLGWTSGRKPGDVANAWRELEDIERRDSSGTLNASWRYRRFMVAAVIARAGPPDSALAVINRTRDAKRPDGTSPGYLEEAWVRLLLGDRPRAMTLLEQHIAAAPMAAAFVSQIPWFAPLHADPRFEAAVRRAH